MDGALVTDCPHEMTEAETIEMLAWHDDWTKGIHPVALGRAPWVPSPFVQAMHYVGSMIARCQAERVEENRSRAG